MANEEPEFDNWKDAWEYHARNAQESFLTRSEDELLALIRKDKTDMFYQVWEAISQKGTKEKSAPVLLKYLEKHPGDNHFLDRFHCSEALYKILGIPPSKKEEDDLRLRTVMDDYGEKKRREALAELRILVERKISSKTKARRS